MSTRSDVDILLVTDSHVTPEDVRDYAFMECPALDLFFVDRGIATSCANGSKVRGRSKRDLVARLGALKLWDRATGFLNVDVDWKFEVIKGYTPIYTTMVSSSAFPSKAEAIASTPPVEPKPESRWRELATHPITIIAGALIVGCSLTYAVVSNLRVTPLTEDISRLKQRLEETEKQLNEAKKMPNPESRVPR